jgi:hypothetical protein
MRELESVVLLVDQPDWGLAAGDVGTVVHVYGADEAYEVEFTTLSGQTLAVLTLRPSEVRAVTERDLMHVRLAGVLG